MAHNLEKFLEHGACIPEDMLQDYAESRLSSHQSHLVEKHLLECEMCSDALEGLKMMLPSKSKEIIADLNKEIDRRVQSTGNLGAKVIPFSFNYRIAAVITLFVLFGGGYLYFKNKGEEKMLAQNNPPSATAISDSISPQAKPHTNSDQKSSESVSSQHEFSLEEESRAPQSQKALEENKDIPLANEIKKNEVDFPIPENDNLILNDKAAGTRKKESIDDLAKRQSDVSGEVSQASKSVPAMMETVEFAKGSKTQKDESRNRMDRLPPDLFSLNVIFTKAKNLYNQKKYSEAANDFEKLINDTATSFYDDAKWMLANCYLKTSRNAKAVLLLREIANSNSPHKKEAQGLLQE